MITLDVADLVVIAGQVLGTGPEAALAQLDIAAAQAALAQVPSPDPTSPDPTSSAEPAAASAAAPAAAAAAAAARLMHALLRHRPFPDHGEQVAVAAGLQFLALNGWQADLDPPGAALVVIEGLASARLSPADAAAWLSPRLSPHSASSAPPAYSATIRITSSPLLQTSPHPFHPPGSAHANAAIPGHQAPSSCTRRQPRSPGWCQHRGYRVPPVHG